MRVRIPCDYLRSPRLERVLQATNSRWWRVAFSVQGCSREELGELLSTATWIALRDGKRFAVASFDDLIRAAAPERARVLKAVREELDAMWS